MTDTATPLLEEPGSTLTDPQTLVDTYADRLMDELFSPVENALAGDEAALASLQEPLIAPEPPPAPEPEPALAPPVPQGPALAALEELTTPAVPAPRSPWWQTPRGMAALGVGTALALGIWGWYQWRQATQVPVPDPTVATDAPNPDAEFLAYLRRSLEVIGQSTPAEGSTPGLVQDIPVTLDGGFNGAIAGLGSSPEATVPSGPPQINVIERIYIPYQLEDTTPRPVAPAPAAPAAPSAQAPAGAPPVLPPTPSPVSPTPAVTQTLVGVLELGDRSAALFEIAGVPQRVYIGERIGSSGWFLVSVGDGEAVVRRNGEVRSISIGQRF